MSDESKNIVEDCEYRVTPFQQALAACSGAVLTSLLVTPLDVVKIRMQAQQTASAKCFLYCNGLMDHICVHHDQQSAKNWFKKPGHFTGTFDAFYKIVKTEGIQSLWSGLSPTLVLAVPATIIYFVTYEQLKFRLRNQYNRILSKKDNSQPFFIPLISGGTARLFSVTVVSPLELIRTKMQSQRLSYTEIGQALKLLVKNDGIRALWMGVVPTLWRDVPFSGIYWANYEMFKELMGGHNETFGKSFVCGALAGAIAATVTTPFDVVKTRQQLKFGDINMEKTVESLPGSLRQICCEQGVRGLFVGLLPRLIKVAPSCAIMISTFEYGKRFFHRLAEEPPLKNIRSEKTLIGNVMAADF